MFDPAANRIPQREMEEWGDRRLTGDMWRDMIPRITSGGLSGKTPTGKTVDKLASIPDWPVNDTFRLLGKFLQCMGADSDVSEDLDAFKSWLSENETPEGWQDSVVAAISYKIQKGFAGFNLEMTQQQMTSSRMDK